MRGDVTDELTVIRSWRDIQPAGAVRDATVAGFLWALALAADVDVVDLQARLDAPRGVPPVADPVVPVTDPQVAPRWPGLGIARIERTREVGDGPPREARAFTAGPDCRPVALAASYAEMAANPSGLACDLSDDTQTPETGADVLVDTTT